MLHWAPLRVLQAVLKVIASGYRPKVGMSANKLSANTHCDLQLLAMMLWIRSSTCSCTRDISHRESIASCHASARLAALQIELKLWISGRISERMANKSSSKLRCHSSVLDISKITGFQCQMLVSTWLCPIHSRTTSAKASFSSASRRKTTVAFCGWSCHACQYGARASWTSPAELCNFENDDFKRSLLRDWSSGTSSRFLLDPPCILRIAWCRDHKPSVAAAGQGIARPKCCRSAQLKDLDQMAAGSNSAWNLILWPALRDWLLLGPRGRGKNLHGVQASNFPVHEMHEAFPPKAGAENIWKSVHLFCFALLG